MLSGAAAKGAGAGTALAAVLLGLEVLGACKNSTTHVLKHVTSRQFPQVLY